MRTCCKEIGRRPIVYDASRKVRRTLCMTLIAVLTLLIGAVPVLAETLQVVLHFDEKEVVFAKENGYDIVRLDHKNTHLNGKPGEPLLPIMGTKVLLPHDAEVVNISVTVDDAKVLPHDVNIFPAQPSVPVGQGNRREFVRPDRGIYSSDGLFPQEAAELTGVGTQRGYRLANLAVRPIAFRPQSRQLILRKTIRIELEVQESRARLTDVKYKSRVFESHVKRQVVNPEKMDAYYESYFEDQPVNVTSKLDAEQVGQEGLGTITIDGFYVPPDPDVVKYLLICDGDENNNMLDEFVPLLEWKTQKGVPAASLSVQHILATYWEPGDGHQQQIKRCIKSYYENKGTEWVVLAGDSDTVNPIIPVIPCYNELPLDYGVGGGWYWEPTVDEVYRISDLYYACFDGYWSWDYDNDGRYAELEDGPDLDADVFLGRLPVRTETDAETMVNKILSYEKEQPSTNFSNQTLLCAVPLYDALPTYDGVRKSNLMWYGNTAGTGGHTGQSSLKYYYDGDSYPDAVTADGLNSHLEDGPDYYNYLHVVSHGHIELWGTSTAGESWYTVSDAQDLSNEGYYTNIMTMACLTNAFGYNWTGEPCLSEALLRTPNGGAVSYIGSNHFGWASTSVNQIGPSLQYSEAFYDRLFENHDYEYPQHLGSTYNAMKEDLESEWDTYGYFRDLLFSINLMGDPEMCLFTQDPQTIASADVEFDVLMRPSAETLTISTDIVGARFCLWKEDENYYHYGIETDGIFEPDETPENVGEMLLTVTAPNYSPATFRILVTADPAYLVKNSADNVVAAFLSTGDVWLRGTLETEQSSIVRSGDSEFVIQNGAAQDPEQALIDEMGNMYIKGELDDGLGNTISLDPYSSEFAIQDASSTDIVCRITNSGYLDVAGTLIESKE